jgi:hypothetical protein
VLASLSLWFKTEPAQFEHAKLIFSIKAEHARDKFRHRQVGEDRNADELAFLEQSEVVAAAESSRYVRQVVEAPQYDRGFSLRDHENLEC